MATHRFVIEGLEYEVEVGARTGNTVAVRVNGKDYAVEVHGAQSAAALPAAAPAPEARAPAVARPKAAAGSGEIRAPISGVVLNVAVEKGQKVTTGTILLVLEAMKMENEIFSPMDGVVTAVSAKPQQEVRQGDLLLTITPA